MTLIPMTTMSYSATGDPTANPTLQSLSESVERRIAVGSVVGAQALIGRRDETVFERCFGRASREDARPVDPDTRFCIGSCSKPAASACVMTTVADGHLDLDAPIDRWLPEFWRLRIAGDGLAPRAPTVRETMCHRAGFYSQKHKMSARQRDLIRDFTQTLDGAVNGMAREDLLSAPGTQYAYSGAGYCVLGRVAEAATGESFETLLRQRVCVPLGMSRTTYFPPQADNNIAVGHITTEEELTVNCQAPHLLGDRHRFALIGGSLYSTARDMARFARMILNEGRQGDAEVLPRAAWLETIRRPSPDQAYGLGWGMAFRNGADRPFRLSHGGALFSYRSLIAVDLDSGWFAVANWTVDETATPREEDETGNSVEKAVKQALNALAAAP